jgi:thiazole/oxazole-forming peptide maturase SagD family component
MITEPPVLLPLDLSQGAGAALLDGVAHATSPQLTALASRLARTFVIVSPFAPEFCCIGAEVALDEAGRNAYGSASLSVTGNGTSLEDALTACLGETADRLSQVAYAGDVGRNVGRRVADGWIADAIADAQGWMQAWDLVDGTTAAVPAELCVRPSRIRRIGALSAGVAAGADRDAATLRATLELCERDAAALWWLGGCRPRAFPLEHAASRAGLELVTALRRGRTERQTLLLDIATDIAVPAVAAVSFDAAGRGLACGLAARLRWDDAARAAVLELLQMELAAPIAEAKLREAGATALTEPDRQHLRRAAFAAQDCALLSPRGASTTIPQAPHLAALTAQLRDRNIRLFAVDLTRPDIGVPVVRALSPELQPYTADVVTERLRSCGAGRDAPVVDVPLI